MSDALRHGSYREWQWLGDPIANRFPPGYPLLLMFTRVLVPDGLFASALLGIVMSVLGLIALYDVLRRRFGTDIGLASIAVIAVNPALVANAGQAMSESVFTSLILLTLWAALRADESNRGSDAALVGALSILAAFVRAAGLTIPIALLVHWALARRWKWVATLALASVCTIGVWHAWTAISPSREARRSYVADAISLVQTQEDQPPAMIRLVNRTLGNTRTYVTRDLPWMLEQPTIPGTLIDNLFWLVLNVGTILVGLVLLWRRWRPAALFILVYGALLVSWRWPIDRFLHPALPFLLIAMMIGAARIGSFVSPRARAWAVGLLLVLLATPALVQDRIAASDAGTCRANPYAHLECANSRQLAFVSLARFAGRELPDGAVVFAPKERAFYYHSGLQLPIMDALLAVPSDSFSAALRASGVTHAVLSVAGFGYGRTRVALLGMCRELDVIRIEARESLLFALRPDTLGARGAACAQLEHTRSFRRAGSVLQPVASALRGPGSNPSEALRREGDT